MGWNERATLIHVAPDEPTVNSRGFAVPGEERGTTVFADRLSAGVQEFYRAAQAGHKVQLKLEVYAFEYSGQPIVEFPAASGKRYRVARTYRKRDSDTVELTLEDMPEPEQGEHNGETEP